MIVKIIWKKNDRMKDIKIKDKALGWITAIIPNHEELKRVESKNIVWIARKNTIKKLSEDIWEICPKCKVPLIIKLGKFGKFYACSGFPKCRYTESLEENKLKIKCPKCNVLMEQGLLADFQQGGVIQTLWVAGDQELEFNAWIGELMPKSRRRLPVLAFRCPECGFLEFYAKET